MPAPILGRQSESRAIAEFLDSSAAAPAALIIEGEPGIGKTTLWWAGVDLVRERGFEVLLARAASAESVLAYAALADMLADVDPDEWSELPDPQRMAIDRVLMRDTAADVVTDPRAVAAGFLSLVNCMADTTPVLLAIDDLQWLDSSSTRVVAFAARRLSGRSRVLVTVRREAGGGQAASWVQLPGTAEVQRIALGPLTLGGLRELLTQRLGRSLPRAAMVRICELSGGNPFYALELARVMDQRTSNSDVLPGSLAEVMRARIGSLEAEVQDALLAAACAAAPTVELVARATRRDVERVVGRLDDAEDNGIVRIDGHWLHFTHPLLARGVYTEATPAQRRAMHRSLADVVEEPELRARHLALAAVSGDSNTLESLDDAADLARARGAPAAAAELVELAVNLGGDTAERRIRLADSHFAAGDVVRARAVLEETIASLQPGPLRAAALRLLGPIRIFDDSFSEGVAALERALAEAPDDLPLRVQTSVMMLFLLFNIGQLAAAARRLDGVVVDAERLGDPLLLSQALSMRAFLRFLRGDGLDDASMRAALEMEDRHTETAARSGFEVITSPRSNHAILLGWTGQLERAHEEMKSLRRSCVDHGLENDLVYVTYYSVQVEIWRGDFTEATKLAERGMESALAVGGEVATGAVLTWRAALAAYAGDEAQVRRDVPAAVAAMQRCGAHMLEGWPIAVGGFLEVSLGNYEAALATLEPLIANLREALDATEIYLAEFVPDAVEAFVNLGRLDEAKPLVDALERNGRRLDRAWMLAVGARCRSMLLAERGDVGAALGVATTAMDEHDRLPMPFERARTQLFLGHLQRRQRRWEVASTTLRGALAVFEELGTPLWADRARAELAWVVGGSGAAATATESERKVAELAVSGMTNNEIAAALFISTKTVEARLARLYRKLGISSRAELGRVMGRRDRQTFSALGTEPIYQKLPKPS